MNMESKTIELLIVGMAVYVAILMALSEKK